MGGFALNFAPSGSNPALAFDMPPGGTVVGKSATLPVSGVQPAVSFDPSDPGSYINAADNLGGLALAFLKQVQGNDLQNEIVAANKGQGGAVVTPSGTTAVGAGVASGAFGGSSTLFGIPVMYLFLILIVILLFKR